MYIYKNNIYINIFILLNLILNFGSKKKKKKKKSNIYLTKYNENMNLNEKIILKKNY
jgi:hypothetical protein